MNSLESSTVIYSRLSSLDPENASKIMGFILIHGPSEADMMSLASAPDSLLQQLIARGKTYSSILTSKNSTLEGLLSPNGCKAAPSYASVVNGSCKLGEGGVEEEVDEQQLEKSDDMVFDLGVGGERLVNNHRRSLSVSVADEMLNGGGGFGWRSSAIGGCGGGVSPGKNDGFEQEMLRYRATQQQRLAFANSFPYNKYFTDSPRSMAAAMLMDEELHKLGQLRHDLSDIAFMGSTSSSRQIYLTFPADSTFREEDISNYFSIYGPVQDVRIPYQQKRMFGFVTFMHPDTVKIILAKGNPHFVCESRVLVKPYKEKGKVEKKHLMMQQQLERGDLSCLSPRGADIRDFDVRVGPRMFFNNIQELLLRKKIEEQAEFQKALEIQSRKLANLQLLDLNNLSRHHPFSQSPNLSPAATMPSPNHHPLLSPNHMRSMSSFNQNAFEENITAPTLSLPPHLLANRQMSMEGVPNINNHYAYTTNNTSENGKLVDSVITKSSNPVLPDSLDDTTFARSAFSRQLLVSNDNGASCSSPFSSNSTSIVSSACLSDTALPKSRFLDSPSFGATGSTAIEM